MPEVKRSLKTSPMDLSSVMDRIGGDEAFLQELIDIFIEDFIGKYNNLKQAIDQNDFQAIKVIGHSLRGSSGNLSLTELLATTTDLEQSGKEKNIEQAKFLFIQLNKEFERLKNYLPLDKRRSIDKKWEDFGCEEKSVLSRENPETESGISILAADDSVPNQVLMKFYATQAGFQIDIARDGREAVEFFRKKEYAIVFLDIHMPEIDGFEALNQIRQIETENILPKTPVIALTGSTFEEEGTTCLDAGFDDFIEKASLQETLVDIIQKHVQLMHVEVDKLQLDESILPLIPDYLENRKEDLQKIRHALENKNFRIIEDLGHKMKGSGKCYGFAKISMLGNRFEASAKQKNTGEIEVSIGQMQDYLSTLQIK
jgi:CheY-like chemotaxis protein